jgi:GDP-L-fucose synthase
MNSQDRIFVAGHRGMVGSALVRALQGRGYTNIISVGREKLDLRDGAALRAFLEQQKPDIVIGAAARVGGIHANSTYPAEFIYDNLSTAMNLTHEAWRTGVKRLVFLGSTCIYPRMAPQPIPESALLSGPLETTNEAYAIAKIAGLKLCEHYRAQYGVTYHAAMPTNLYGPGDHYDLLNSHVLPALLRKMHEAKQAEAPSVTIWGSGAPRREFLHVDDCAGAILHLLELDDPPDLVNIGNGKDVTIRELAETIRRVVGYQGDLIFDTSKPDGTPRKLCDSSLLRSIGWLPSISLEDGIRATYFDLLKQLKRATVRGWCHADDPVAHRYK